MNDAEARLQRVLDAYGASPERWPEEERSTLLALIERSVEARQRLDAAAELDHWLDAASAPEPPSPELMERILAGADQKRGEKQKKSWRWAAVIPLAAAAALALWIQRTPTVPPAQPVAEIAMADLGIYDMPSDVLLEIDGFDPLASIPSYECAESELGCLELETDSGWFQRQSTQGGTRRTFT